jgi:hypothetical protein
MDARDYAEAQGAGAMEEFRTAIRQAILANLGRHLIDASNTITDLRVKVPGIPNLMVTWEAGRGEWCSNW